LRNLNSRARRLACTLLFSYWLVACASSPQARLLLSEPPDVPSTAELKEVPFYPQQEYHCGPAALAGIYNYRGKVVQPEEVAGLVYIPGLKGSLQVEMAAATRQYGLLAVPLDGQLDSLLHELAAGNPILVLQNLGVDAFPVWHYEIVIGYDLARRQMILRSGLDRRVTRSFSIFEKTWQRADHWALVIVNPDTIPVTVSVETYLGAVIDLEQVGQFASAQQAYTTAIRRWPDNILALIGQANSSYALGDYVTAATAYRQALKIAPENAGLWNNFAYVLAQLGQQEAALSAVKRALEIDPDNANYRSSYLELEQWQ